MGTDRRLDPVRTTVTPSGHWRLAYPLAVWLAGGGLLVVEARPGARALLATPGRIGALGALALTTALAPLLYRGSRPSPADLEPGAMSWLFGFAVMLGWGVAAGVLVTGATTLLAALAWRLPPLRCLLDAARLVLATAAAGAAWRLLGGPTAAGAAELAALAVAALSFLLVVHVLAAEPALAGGSIAGALRRRVSLGALTSALLLGLAPVAVVIAERRLPLFPLLLLPVAAVQLAACAARRAECARELAERERAGTEVGAETLLATVSHELRAPLTVVLGSLDTLTTRDAVLEPEQRRELVAIAARQGERLKRLVEQLLEAARLEQVEQGPARDSVIDAVKVAREAERATELCHPGRHVHLDAGMALPVRAAPEMLLQVLTNLLDNAAKYSPGGTPILLQARDHGGQAVIAVIDAGPGVPAGQRERIFERFTQLESSDGRRGEGAGLGLYIARKLARCLGGDLVLCQTRPPARGARFELRLPLADEGQAQVTGRDGEPPSRALAGGPATRAHGWQRGLRSHG